MNRSVVPGSLSAVASQNGQDLAGAFLGCEIMAIVDTSSSMSYTDSWGGRSRYDVACEELARLQAANPGKVGVISFSDHAEFCPGGTPTYLGAGTSLDRALEFAKIVDGTVRFVCISDGEPNDEASALRVAATMQSEINCIFVGPEGGRGAAFLAKLARRKGGKYATATAADLLGDKVGALLLR